MTDRLAAYDAALLDSVRLGEGLRFAAYADPESALAKQLALPLMGRQRGWSSLSGAPWTIGYGHTGVDVSQGQTCSKNQAEGWLQADLAAAMESLDQREPAWRNLSLGRQRVLAEMTFNMGYGRLAGFHRMWNAMFAGRYAEAAAEMLDSDWARQVGDRAKRLAAAMQEG